MYGYIKWISQALWTQLQIPGRAAWCSNVEAFADLADMSGSGFKPSDQLLTG